MTVHATWNRRFPGLGILAFRDGWIVDLGPDNCPPWASIGNGRSWPWIDFLTIGNRDLIGGDPLEDPEVQEWLRRKKGGDSSSGDAGEQSTKRSRRV